MPIGSQIKIGFLPLVPVKHHVTLVTQFPDWLIDDLVDITVPSQQVRQGGLMSSLYCMYNVKVHSLPNLSTKVHFDAQFSS